MKKFLRPSFLTRNIILLSIVSFMTDVASEMVYPVIPLYLAQLGLGVAAIGLLEGAAISITGLTQGWFGYWSDRLRNPTLFVRIGYGLSALAKPMLAIFATVYVWLFTARMLDRLGKAIRSSSRDAILANDSKDEDRGKVFGFHRSMDTAGAALGPIIALAFLFYWQGQYSTLFMLAAIPGVLAVLFTFMVKNKKIALPTPRKRPPGLADYKEFWKNSSPTYRKILLGYIMLALINSSDFFILLRASELGANELYVIGFYILYNFIFALAAFPMGALADRIGFRKVYLLGLIVFTFVYAAFARQLDLVGLAVIFGIYGIFAAANEAVAKGWLTRHLDSDRQATGMGLFLTLNSLAFLIASLVTGLIWQYFGSVVAFAVISTLSLGVIIYFATIKFGEPKLKPAA